MDLPSYAPMGYNDPKYNERCGVHLRVLFLKDVVNRGIDLSVTNIVPIYYYNILLLNI